MHAKPHYRVVAGIIFNENNQILLATRPKNKSFAGYWEFPGGKIETGESALDALVRELDEEIGISVRSARPWLCLENERSDAKISLQFWQIAPRHWSGTPAAREGQTFAWQNPRAPDVAPMLPNNLPILHALALPTELLGTPATGLYTRTGRCCALPAARHHLNPDTALLLDAANIGNRKIETAFWALVCNRRQWQLVADAAAVIWTGSVAELAALLDEGVSLPVFAPYRTAKEAALLYNAGLHGFIYTPAATENV